MNQVKVNEQKPSDVFVQQSGKLTIQRQYGEELTILAASRLK